MVKKTNISWQLKKEIAKAVNACLDSLNMTVEAVSIEHPTAEEHGDYSTNVALQLAKQLKGNPRKIAEKIVGNLAQNVSIAGPGFINFTLSNDWLVEQVNQVLAEKEKYGSTDQAETIGKWKTVIVEYSSPNIAKPFGIGHMRSTIIGDAIQKILKFQGYNVVTDNHLGDWGTQFGKLCYAIKTWGNEAEIFSAEEPIKSLVRLYVQFHTEAEKDEAILAAGREWFAKLEKGDLEARRLWKLCVDASMKEFMEIYELLGVSFDFYNGEAFFEDKLAGIIKLAKKSKHARENDGALLVFFPDEGKTPLMLLKSDGSTLYATRDLATDQYRIDKYGKETFIINETGLEQGFYWQQIHEAEELLGIVKMDQRKAILHGLMLTSDGKKFSTRKGDELWLKDVLNEAIAKARKIMDERKIGEELPEEEKVTIAKAVGIGGLKYNDLKQGHQKDIIFDWEKVINLEGDSGPYIQYTYARARSVLRKAENVIPAPEPESLANARSETSSEMPDQVRHDTFTQEELAILRWIYRFPEVVEQAARTYSPNLICSFLFELAKRFNNFYNNVPILPRHSGEELATTPESPNVPEKSDSGHGQNDELVVFRLNLVEATSIVIKNGLNLLGIEALERM